MESRAKHAHDQSSVEITNKRPKLDDSLLQVDKDFKDRSLGSLTKADLWEMFYEIKKLGFDHALARACLHNLQLGSVALQERYHKLYFNDPEAAEKIILKDDIARPKAKVCARAIRTFKAVQDACKTSKNHETYFEAVKLGAAYYSILFSIEGKKSEDHVTAAKNGFEALLEILEAQDRKASTSIPSEKTRSTQAEETPAPRHQTNQAVTSDLTSDDCLQTRVLQCQLVMDEKNIEWDQIGGQDVIKASLQATMETLMLRSHARKTDKYPGQPSGLLLHGPQGCGKTSLACSFAKEYKVPIFQLSSDITGRFCGETTKTLTKLFSHLRTIGPCVLLMDEVSGLLQRPNQGAGNTTMLLEMQEHLKMLWSQLMNSELPVFVIGTTNSPWRMETSDFRRRFGLVEYVALPDASARRDLWIQSIHGYYTSVSDAELAKIADRSPGYSADDMNRIVKTIIEKLRSKVLRVNGFKKATFQGEERLIPSPTGPFDVAKAFQQLTANEQSDVLYEPLQAGMIEECLKSGRFKTVSLADVQKHEDWEKATMS